MNELQEYVQRYIRKLYSDILDHVGGNEDKFVELASQAAHQIAKETYRLIPYEEAEKAFDIYGVHRKISPIDAIDQGAHTEFGGPFGTCTHIQ